MPLGLGDRFVAPTGHQPRRADLAPIGSGELANPQLGAVPRHVGVVPLQPAQVEAVGAHPRCRDEIRTGDDHDRLAAGLGLDGDQLIVDLTACVALADADDPPPIRGEGAVGVAIAHRFRRLGRERHREVEPSWLGVGINPVEALIGPVGEEERVVVQPPGAAAVLVHPGAGRELLAEHLDGIATQPVAHHRDPTGLLGARFGPPDVIVADPALAQADGAGDHQVGGDRRRPGPVGQFVAHRMPPLNRLPRPTGRGCGRCPRPDRRRRARTTSGRSREHRTPRRARWRP